jgi:hypothetical protein
MRSFFIFFIVLFLVAGGCQKAPMKETNIQTSGNTLIAARPDVEESVPTNTFQPFKVYFDKGTRDNHYIPSGFMPNGNCIEFNDAWQEGCQTGNTCMKIVYDVKCSREDQKWAGIFWQNPPNNWGSRKGGFDLTGAQKLTFWAKGEKGGERIEEFNMGGITGDFPDSDSAVIGPVILSNEWKEYTIDLRGKDLSYISGGFSWTTNVDFNPDSCVFYLDNIRYE